MGHGAQQGCNRLRGSLCLREVRPPLAAPAAAATAAARGNRARQTRARPSAR